MRILRRKFYFVLLGILFFQQNFAQDIKIPYYPGEKMEFVLSMGRLKLGRAEISFKADSVNCGSYIYASGRSTGFVKFLKDIEYTFKACMDPKTGLPINSTRVIREGDYFDSNTVHYYHNLREDSSVVFGKRIDSVVVPKNIFDILTGYYHFRSNVLYPDIKYFKISRITTFFVDEVWTLTNRFAGIETIETKLGEKECIKVMPVTEISRYFKTTEEMVMWVTNDKYMIPVKIYVNLRIGSITANIERYTPPKY